MFHAFSFTKQKQEKKQLFSEKLPIEIALNRFEQVKVQFVYLYSGCLYTEIECVSVDECNLSVFFAVFVFNFLTAKKKNEKNHEI